MTMLQGRPRQELNNGSKTVCVGRTGNAELFPPGGEGGLGKSYYVNKDQVPWAWESHF